MRSLRRPGRPADQAAAAERVRGLLHEGPAGWVPPPLEAPAAATGRARKDEDADEDADEDEDEDGGPPAPGGWGPTPLSVRGRHAAPPDVLRGPRVGAQEATDPVGRGLGPRHAEPQSAPGTGTGTGPGPSRGRGRGPGSGSWTLAPSAVVDPAVGDPAVEESAVVGPAAQEPAVEQPAWAEVRGPTPQAPPAARLLDRLRAGRLDPGRAGAVGLALVGVLACLLAGVLVLRSAPEEIALPTVEQAGRPIDGATLPTPSGSAGSEPPPGPDVVVAVAGRVRRPGLVRLAPGSRVDDALRAAGGLQPGASPGLLNLARPLVDGEQVLVGVEPPPGAAALPGAAGPGAAGPGVAGPPAQGALVDLNTATTADLDRLPGIGPVLAERILEHRTRNGPFRSVDQLREVTGIGEAKFSSLRDVVTV